jgi:hypothetical protein
MIGLVAIGATAALALPGAADAKSPARVVAKLTLRESRGLPGGPALAGTRVLWVDGSRFATLRVRSKHGTAPARTIARLETGDALDIAVFDLAGSKTRAAFGLLATGGDSGGPFTERRALYAGPLAGPLTSLGPDMAGPRPSPTPAGDCSPSTSGFSLSGDLLAYRDGACAGSSAPPQLVVRDLAAGTRTVVTARADLGAQVAIAGRFVAWIEEATGSIVVFDRAAGAAAYRTPAAATDERVVHFALEADGTLAVVRLRTVAGTSHTNLAWYSVAAPTRHDIPGHPSGPIRIADGRIAYRANTRRLLHVVSVGSKPGRLVRARRGTIITGFDWDGRRLAWADAHRRNRAVIRVARVP